MHTLPNLPAGITHEVYATLCGSLPPPIPDTPDSRAGQADSAMAAVAALHPADAIEARLAGQVVAADAHAMACLRHAAEAIADPAEAHRCRAQAGCMMRQMQTGMRMLERRQATRDKALATMHPGAMERAGYWFCDVSVPAPEPAPITEPATEAEADPVRLIPDRTPPARSDGASPARLGFGNPAPELMQAFTGPNSAPPRPRDVSLHETTSLVMTSWDACDALR